MKPKVINIKNAPVGWKTNMDYVYIGRAGHGQDGRYGNPIDANGRWDCPVCKQRHHGAGSTLACYEIWLRDRIALGRVSGAGTNERVFYDVVKNLAGKTLVCFCKPRPCHGDILAKICEELNQED